MYKIKLIGNNATAGSMKPIEAKRGETVKLPANKYKRAGFKFVGWSTKRNNKIDMDHLQLGKPKYKNKDEVKNLGKDGETVKLYACWKGCGPEAAAAWAVRIAKDNSFNYGTGKRAHHCGCYFCGTNISGPKHAPMGSAWEKTYCCNPFGMAALVHGAGIYPECKNSSLKVKWWLGLKGGKLFERVGRNVKWSDLKPGDFLIKENRHLMIYVGKTSRGNHRVAQAMREGWDKGSITVTHPDTKRIGLLYVAIRMK